MTRPSPTSPRPSDWTRRMPARIAAGGSPTGTRASYDKAIADFTEAIRLDPNWPRRITTGAIAYGSKGDYDKAIADYTEAIRLDPKDAEGV